MHMHMHLHTASATHTNTPPLQAALAIWNQLYADQPSAADQDDANQAAPGGAPAASLPAEAGRQL
jgi:hypothetical protein